MSRDVINNVKSKKNFFSSSTQLYVILNTVACDRKIRSKIKLYLKAFFSIKSNDIHFRRKHFFKVKRDGYFVSLYTTNYSAL